jgi:hypothetical protein
MSDAEVAAAPATAAAVDLDSIVERYIQLRDRKDQLVSAHKLELAKFEAAMERVENYLLRHLNVSNSESIRTKAGTFFKTTKTSAQVADWDATSEWIKDDIDTRWPMLEKRVSKGFVEAYKEEHNDLPPGINWRSEVAVNIRRA